MGLDEVAIRIDYFHNASDDHLRHLGVDRRLLPDRDSWLRFYRDDYALPIEDRLNYNLLWLLDDEVVGFSTADPIRFGEEAFMHLHILEPGQRHQGLGQHFVRLSARKYFRTLHLQRLFCEPNALNVAPNRTLQRAGFRYLFSHRVRPNPINFPQVTTRWVLDGPRVPPKTISASGTVVEGVPWSLGDRS
ncbi:MAG: GNAT family N-acetyltransferase [Candidatus Dormibacteria bacterium]